MLGRERFHGWSNLTDIDRRGRELASARDWEGLWRLVLDVPVAGGVRLARRLGRWTPPRPEQRALLDRLLAAEERLVAKIADLAANEVCTLHPRHLSDSRWVSFAFGVQAMALCTYERPGTTRVSMLRPDGTWNEVYAGELEHDAIGCVDAENVIAVRDDPVHEAALVHYTQDGVRAVATGVGMRGARLAATAEGFVAGLPLGSTVITAGRDLPVGGIELGRFGVGADRLAVDPAGRRVAFGGDGLVITDARMEQVIARNAEPVPHGGAYEVAFTGSGDLVAVGPHGGLSRWRATPGGDLTVEATGASPRMSRLFSIPAWGVIGGHDPGDGVHRFYDPGTLRPVEQPRAFTMARYDSRWVQAVAASADGRLVAVGGQLLADAPDRSLDLVMAVYDLRHPLAPALLPIAALDAGDLAGEPLDAAGTARYGTEASPVLELVRALLRHRLAT